MVDLACQYARFNDRHRKHADWHALLSDLPARRSVTAPVPAFLAVPKDVARCVATNAPEGASER
jgi:hypothetical protein